MVSVQLDPIAKLSFDTLRLGYEAHSLIGLRLIEMATGGVPALPEALRMIPEKIDAFVHAQVVVTTSVLSGRPDLAPAEVVALYREARERDPAAAYSVMGPALTGPRSGHAAPESQLARQPPRVTRSARPGMAQTRAASRLAGTDPSQPR